MPRALNFGSVRQREQTVAKIAQSILSAMQADTNWVRAAEAGPREAHFLSLDATFARQSLGWIDRYPSAAVVALTAACIGISTVVAICGCFRLPKSKLLWPKRQRRNRLYALTILSIRRGRGNRADAHKP